MARRFNLARTLSVAVATLALGACGADKLPSRAKFIEELAGGYATELQGMAKDHDLDAKKLRAAYEELLGCFYDNVKPDDLRSLIDDESTATFDRLATGDGKACEDSFRDEIAVLAAEPTRGG